MFVYLAKDTKKPQFKIGKANVVLNRLLKLGDLADFDLKGSFCIRLPSPADALRVESALQHFFHPWWVPPDESNRKDGDTEIYKIECFERVLRLVYANSDLFFGAVPEPIPLPDPAKAKAPAQRLRERQMQMIEEQAVAGLKFDIAMVVFHGMVSRIMELKPEVFELCEYPEPKGGTPKQVILIESKDREIVERALGLVRTLSYLMFTSKRSETKVGQSLLVKEVSVHWGEGQDMSRLQAELPIAVTEKNRLELNPEYVEIHDMIPRSQVPRRPIEVDIAAWLKNTDRYLPMRP